MALIRNKHTGRMLILNDEKKRQDRLIRRLRMFWRAMDGYTGRAWFVTLTYRHDVKWEPYHITKFTKKLKDQGCLAYAWTAEVQPNTGRVHYHIVVIGNRPAWTMQRWGKGRTEVKPCWSIGYLLKYTWKGLEGDLPKGTRRFGIGIKSGLLCPQARFVVALSKLPPWVAKPCEAMGELAERVGQGRWMLTTGLIVENDWARM